MNGCARDRENVSTAERVTNKPPTGVHKIEPATERLTDKCETESALIKTQPALITTQLVLIKPQCAVIEPNLLSAKPNLLSANPTS